MFTLSIHNHGVETTVTMPILKLLLELFIMSNKSLQSKTYLLLTEQYRNITIAMVWISKYTDMIIIKRSVTNCVGDVHWRMDWNYLN